MVDEAARVGDIVGSLPRTDNVFVDPASLVTVYCSRLTAGLAKTMWFMAASSMRSSAFRLDLDFLPVVIVESKNVGRAVLGRPSDR